jgi:hypothetical protein
MGILTPVVQIAALSVFYPWQYLTPRCAVALELIRDEHPGDILTAFEQLTEELLRRLFVPPALHEDVEDIVVLIHRSPEGMTLPVNGQKDFIQVPFIPRLRAPATQAIGILLPELPTPWTDGFMGHRDTTLKQEFLHVAVAQGEAIVEPDSMADDLAGKAVVLIASSVSRWSHVGCLF